MGCMGCMVCTPCPLALCCSLPHRGGELPVNSIGMKLNACEAGLPLRTAPKDRLPPPTTNCQPPFTTNRHQPPAPLTVDRHSLPTATKRQPMDRQVTQKT